MKYIYTNEEITGVDGEETVDLKYFTFPVLITKEKEYFNVYYLDPRFKLEPINNLHEQIPLENEPENWDYYLDLRVIEWNLWFKYNKNFSIEVLENED